MFLQTMQTRKADPSRKRTGLTHISPSAALKPQESLRYSGGYQYRKASHGTESYLYLLLNPQSIQVARCVITSTYEHHLMVVSLHGIQICGRVTQNAKINFWKRKEESSMQTSLPHSSGEREGQLTPLQLQDSRRHLL